MSITAVSSNPLINPLDPNSSATSGLPSSLQTLVSNFNTLGQSLSAGNLTGAQQAFTSLLQSVPTSGTTTAGSGTGSAAGVDIASLGQALQSGNLAGAQQAFSNLQQAMQAADPAQGHKGSGGAAKVGGGTASGSASDASSTVTNEVTTTNADGTLTVTTTYADGSTSTTTEANPTPTVNTNKLDQSNGAQLLTLLGAQEKSQAT